MPNMRSEPTRRVGLLEPCGRRAESLTGFLAQPRPKALVENRNALITAPRTGAVRSTDPPDRGGDIHEGHLPFSFRKTPIFHAPPRGVRAWLTKKLLYDT
jgi:hypothetical protein